MIIEIIWYSSFEGDLLITTTGWFWENLESFITHISKKPFPFVIKHIEAKEIGFNEPQVYDTLVSLCDNFNIIKFNEIWNKDFI